MKVAIIADSHVPSRASAIPAEFWERVEAADHVIHAGDFDSKGALADVTDRAEALTAVRGNMDPKIGLARLATVELGGVTFVVTHGTGSPSGYGRRIAKLVDEHATDDPAVGVAGHTHDPLDTVYEGVRLLNPGSVTGASPAERATMMTATAADGDLSVDLHAAEPLGRRH